MDKSPGHRAPGDSLGVKLPNSPMKNYRFLGFLLELQVPGILLRSVKLPNSPNENHRFARFFAWGLRRTGRARVSASRRVADFRHKYFARALDRRLQDAYIGYRSCETPGKPQFIKVPGSRWLPPWTGQHAAARIRKEKNGLVIGTINTCQVGLGPHCSVFPHYSIFKEFSRFLRCIYSS